MTIRLSDLKTYVSEMLGDDPGVFTATEVINLAGKLLITAHQWNWNIRRGVNLNFVANQEYIDLPDNTGRVLTLTAARGIQLTKVSWENLELHRRSNSYVGTGYLYNFSWIEDSGGSAGDTDPPVGIRLELAPTPSANQTAAIVMTYYKKWVDLSADTDRVRIPEDMEPLFYEAVRIVARGFDEDDVMGPSEMLTRFKGLELFRQMKRYDAQITPRGGPMEGGIGMTGHIHTYPDHYKISSVAGP